MAAAQPEPTDEELLSRHVAGDPDAFGLLFTRHRDRLWAVALRTLANPEDAADALQDAMVSAFRRADSFRGGSAVTTWLHRIVVNACLDHLRRAKVRSADPLPDDADRRPAMGGRPQPDVADELTSRSAVLDALHTLPADQRSALVLVDMEGYSIDEAATVLDCPPGTVKSRCARARAKLVPYLSHLRNGEPTEHVEPLRTSRGSSERAPQAAGGPTPHESPGGEGR